MQNTYHVLLCFTSYPQRLKDYIPTSYNVRAILEELHVAGYVSYKPDYKPCWPDDSSHRGPKTFFMTEWSRDRMISFDCPFFKGWMSSVYIVLSLQQQHVQIETQKRNHFTFNHWHFPSLMNGCCSARFKKFPDHSKKVKHSWST